MKFWDTGEEAKTEVFDYNENKRKFIENLEVTKIDNQTRCTHENEDHFTYRRDRITGRQAGLVWL